MGQFFNKNKAYSASFERAQTDFHISDYAIYFLKEFNLEKAYFNIQSFSALNASEMVADDRSGPSFAAARRARANRRESSA